MFVNSPPTTTTTTIVPETTIPFREEFTASVDRLAFVGMVGVTLLLAGVLIMTWALVRPGGWS